jgi:hypothetical protein
MIVSWNGILSGVSLPQLKLFESITTHLGMYGALSSVLSVKSLSGDESWIL